MTKRFDVCSPRPRKDSEKPYWHKVGTAWQTDRGISITFDSLPLPDLEGRVSVVLFEPREKQEASERVPGSAKTPIDLDSEVPF